MRRADNHNLRFQRDTKNGAYRRKYPKKIPRNVQAEEKEQKDELS
jgi:hypothetical protein